MTELLYIAGAPGVGKSTLVERLAARQVAARVGGELPHVVYEPSGVAELGRRRVAFSGTDALAMNIMPRACRWISRRPFERVVAEGDRLLARRFFDAARAAGYDVRLVILDAPAGVLAERRDQRGSRQSPQWLKGRETKVRGWLGEARVVLDATLSVEELIDGLTRVSGVAEALRA